MKQDKEGRAAEIIFHNEKNFYTIAVFEAENEQFTAVGYMPKPSPGGRFRLTGDWVCHPKFGEQFAFTSFEELKPVTTDGIEAFLSSGAIRGVGPVTARAIVKRFGSETLNLISQSPSRLTEVKGIGRAKAEIIAKSYAEHREYAEVVTSLSEFGISPATCFKLYKTYGVTAAEVVKKNPYILIDDVNGIGFRKADGIAQKLGFAADSPFRIKSGIEYYLNERAGSGDTYAERSELSEQLALRLDVTREKVNAALEDLAMDGRVFFENLSGLEIVMLHRFYIAEKKVAYKLYELCRAELKYVSGDSAGFVCGSEHEKKKIVLSESQKKAVVSSLKNGVSVITGGPGTGKTTIINAILRILDAGGLSAALAAPTGRAAKRMSMAAGVEAKTIHRLLEYGFSESGGMRFGRTSENPLDYDCVIIDEVSMVDIILMNALLDAIKLGTRLILVGDSDQLPPVGAGNVLRDIIASGTVHCIRLTEIFRQAAESMIVVNAHRINRGEYPDCNGKNTDFFLVERSSDREIAEAVRELCTQRLPNFYAGIDPLSDIQVLTPTKKGLLGSIELNRMLQEALNPPEKFKSEKKYGGRIYREGDKVMQNRNDYLLEWLSIRDMSKGEGVFNGDVGIVKTVDNGEGTVSVLFGGERLVKYDYTDLDELEPAFAITVHKSQGSEFPVMIMPVSRFAPMLSTRNLLYTAVTRAKLGVVLAGSYEACRAMVDNDSVAHRNSGLAPRLLQLWSIL